MHTRRDMLSFMGALTLAPVAMAERLLPWQARLIRAARQQIGVTRSYDPAYLRLTFPGGDVPRDRGVCTDVIIRAYRDAFQIDLQAVLNADMRRAFSAYPTIWGLSRPDTNIDHRRVPNLETFLRRQGAERANGEGWQPGDLMTCRIDGRLPHIGIVSDKRSTSGQYLVIHNIGRGTREEDILGVFSAERRFRWPASA